MVEFLMIAAALVALVLVMLLLPMRRKQLDNDVDQRAVNVAIARDKLAELKRERDSGAIGAEEFEQARLELEMNLQEDVDLEESAGSNSGGGRFVMPLVAVGVPLLAGLLYMKLGNLDATDYTPGMAGAAMAADHAGTATAQGNMPPIEEALAMLEKKLQENPDNAEGWFMLARTQMALKNYPEATKALRRLRKLTNDDPAVLVRMADSIAMEQGGALQGEPVELLKLALQKDPDNVQGLWLMGMNEYQAQNGRQALDYWTRLEPLLASEPESQQEIRGLMARAAAMAGEPAPTFAKQKTAPQAAPAVVTKDTPSADASAASIRVSVDLAPELRAKVSPEDTVFIYARAVSGPPMPLAVSRKQVKDLPLTVTLDDTMAMMPAMKISAFPQVRVQARVSKSGNAITQPGDLLAHEQVVEAKPEQKAELLIDHVK